MPQEITRQVVGRWTTDPTDTKSLNEYGRTTMIFSDDGRLTYIVHGEIKDEVIVMTYRIDESTSTLITNQPTHEREERTRFAITAEGKLVLDYQGSTSRYVHSTS